MMKFYKILFLFVLVNCSSILCAKNNFSFNDFLLPTATITTNTTSVCVGGTSPVITFSGKDGTAPYTFVYKIGTGADINIVSTGNIATVNVPTTISGVYIYTLVSVTDSSGTQILSDNVTVTVNDLPTVDFTFTNNQCSGTAVQFTTTSSGNTFTWSFGDGATSSNKNPSHTFTSLGCGIKTFNVTLTITDSNGCSSSITKTITINQQPDVNFYDINDTTLGIDPFSNCSNASASNSAFSINVGNISASSGCITSYSVNWGDGQTENGVIFPKTHTYLLLGAYNMIITSKGTNGCSISKTYVIKNVSNPSGGLTSPGSTINLCAPTANIPFVISGWDSNSPGTKYSIDYGDNSTILNITQEEMMSSIYYHPIPPSDNYPVPHSYTTSNCPIDKFVATLIVTNVCGNTTSALQPIKVYSKPIANFTAQSSACKNTNVLFTNTTISGNGISCSQNSIFTWDFGDGSPIISNAPTGSLPQNVNHTYTSSGIYTVTLTAQNYCGFSQPKTQQICIEPPLVPTFTLDKSSVCTPLTVNTTNTTNLVGSCSPPTYLWKVAYTASNCGAAPAVWSYTGGTSETSANPSFSFTTPGTYNITLTTTNSCGSVTSTPQTVTVTKPPTVTLNTIPPICQSLPTTSINPTAVATNCGINTLSYEWSFPGGTPAFSTAAIPGTITYSTTGTFTYSLKVNNECGFTTANSSFTINPSPTISGTLTSCIGATSQLTGSPTATVTSPWASSNTAVATVNSTGLVTGVSAGTTTITYKNSLGCITTALFTVNPSPTVTFNPGPQTICSGDTSAVVTLSSVSGATLSWTAIQPSGITGVITSGTNTISAQTLVNSTNASIDITYNATASLASGATCVGAVFSYTITVKPKPYIAANINAMSCSGVLFSVTPTNGAGNTIPTGTTYSWGIPIVTGGLTGGTSGSNQTSISGTLNNPTNSTQTATYSVTPSLNGCSGTPFDLVVSVNPKPEVNTTPNVILCAGETSTQIDFTGSVSGTTYNWTSNITSIGIPASGFNSIPPFTAINTGFTPILATITVTPVANTCTGTAKTFTITINPKPNVNPITNLVKCNGVASGIITFTGNVTGTTFDWTNDTPAIGLAASGSGNIASFNTINSGLVPVIATIIVTPKANGCLGTPISFTFTVNPTPSVDLPSNQTVCSGLQTNAIVFTGTIPSTIYNWTNSNSSIGLASSGVGDIPTFTTTNNGNVPIIATIKVTPNLNGCDGTPKTFTITINPSPSVIFTPSNQTICSGTASTLVNLSSSTPGTTFTWTAAEPAGISGVTPSGTSTIPVQNITNSTNTPIVITYEAKAESTSGISCQGITYKYTITVNPVPKITTTQEQTICSNTPFSISPSDGGGNSVPSSTTYSWGVPAVTGGLTGGVALSNQATINGTLLNTSDTAQTATYTVTPKSGTCSGSSFIVTITVNPAPKVLFSGSNQTQCSGSSSLPITLSSSTTGDVSFSWITNIPTGISGATVSGTNTIPIETLTNTATTPLTVIYTATATVINNGVSCTGQSLEYKITVNPAIITSHILSNFNGFNVSAEGASDGKIDVSVTGGSGSYTYLWSGPSGFSASSQDITNVPAGNYSLIINDGLCSPVTLNFTLTSPIPLLIEEDLSAHINVFCFSNATGAIKVDITQQSVGPYDYELILQGGGTISTITNSSLTNYTFANLIAGTYDIKVTDANGSEKFILGIIITQPNGITASITAQTNVSCAAEATGSATVTASGGNGTLVYSWNTTPVQTTETATGLIAGTYTVTITDTNMCSVKVNAIITEPSPIITSISSQANVLCFGENTGSVTVLASGGTEILTYSWDTVPIQTTPTATGLVAGTYNLTVTDANNCTKVQTVTITEPSGGLSSSISNSTNVSCFGGNDGNATASVSGGTAPYSYSWNTIPIQTSATATGLKAGTYTVLISDTNGCSTSTNVTISEPLGMKAIISDQTNVFCSGNSTGSATVTATGGTLPYSYSWDTNPIQTSDVAINLAIGTYTVTITDANGCTSTAQAIITEPNGIVTTIDSQTNVDCYGNNTGAVTVLASGGIAPLSYSWDTTPIQTTPTLTGLKVGTYNLTVTDANNCSKVQEVIITEPNDLVITTDLEKDVSCFNAANGEIKISITGGTLNYSFAWTKNGIPYANTEDLSNLSPGTYQVTVSDANNCGPKTASFTITEPPILAVTLIDKTDILCFGEATGAINVYILGGTAPYTFAWSGPNGFTNSNQNLTAIFAGTYQLIVTDNLGCTQPLNITLTQPNEIIITATTTPITCYGANNASITLTINGGITPYTVAWSNLGTGTFQDNLSAGDYLVKVTDANNCSKSLNINIPEAPLFTVNPVVKNISCFGANDGSIALNFVGGVPPIQFSWSDGSNAGTTRNNLKPGTYSVTIIDGTPCTIFRTFTILEPQLLVLSANLTHALDCDNANSGAINLLVSGGSAPFTYSWSNGATTEDLINIPAGNYLVTVKDINGCTKQAQYSINRPPPIVTAVETKTDFNCETKYVKQSFIAKVSGGVPPYNLIWSSGTVSGANNEIMNTSQNGTVILYVNDAIGCKSNYTFTVDIPVLGTPSFNVSSYSYTNYGNYSIKDPIQFTNTATGDFISMIWDFGDGSFATDLNPTHTYLNPKEYVVTQTVTYPFGCVYVHKISLSVEKGYILVVPNAFTPNNDALNDTFRAVTKGLKKVRLDVYDTWGSMIYSETGDVLRGWDGKIKGAEAENGNYYSKVSGTTFYGITVEENHPFVLIK